MSFWTDGKLYKLVKLYSEFSNLWNKKNHCYDNLRSRYTSYNEILASLSMPTFVSVSDVICKLKELRNTYVTELQKVEVASRSGCIYRPNHTWFGIMNEFLYDHLDADEKLAEFSSLEDGPLSSEEILKVCETKNCCLDSDSASENESDSENSLDPRDKIFLKKKICTSCKPVKKSQAYFIRSPTVLRSTKMNTKYEFPRKTLAPSIKVKNLNSKNRNNTSIRAEDMQQCTQLDFKITSSDVSIKYLRTESINGDEKCYKKNLKGPRRSTDKPTCFKNIKMIISKSGYTAPEIQMKSNEKEDEDEEFWEMISMLNLGVPCPFTKMETTYSPNTSCSSITSVDSLAYKSRRISNATCCTSSCKDISDEEGLENIIDEIDTAKRRSKSFDDRFRSRQSCCPKVKEFKECQEMQKRKETLLEPCGKEIKVMCLGDGTLFDDNLLEILQDLSIKICPIDGQCVSGNCSIEQGDDVFESFLSCKSCSSATRPVKEYETNPEGSVVINDVDSVQKSPETPSITKENIGEDKMSSGNFDETTNREKSADSQGLGLDSTGKRRNGSDGPKLEMDGDKKGHTNFELSVFSPERNYDVKLVLESDGRSSSSRDAILHEAKRELWEAGKLYNGGRYITQVTSEKNDDFLDFDNFGTQVACSLKMMGKQRAMKLKQMIAETLRAGKRQKFS